MIKESRNFSELTIKKLTRTFKPTAAIKYAAKKIWIGEYLILRDQKRVKYPMIPNNKVTNTIPA